MGGQKMQVDRVFWVFCLFHKETPGQRWHLCLIVYSSNTDKNSVSPTIMVTFMHQLHCSHQSSRHCIEFFDRATRVLPAHKQEYASQTALAALAFFLYAAPRPEAKSAFMNEKV